MDSVEEIKSKLNIVDLIREYVPLTQTGANFRARCPFHDEKTPSFMVSQPKQMWYCFGGCNEGGDMFSFVMKHEGMEFGEALKFLAHKAGVQLQERDPRVQGQKARLHDLMAVAANYYQQALQRAPQVEHARAYVRTRIPDQLLVDEFGIGAALPDPSALSTYLLSKKFTANEIMQAGLALQKERGYGLIDRFRNRLMITIKDIHGNVIGFGGRVLDGEAKGAKYINSPQTVLYDKSAVLYNLDMAKQAIRKEDRAIIVEGYMDIFAVWGSGMKNVVASSGTALTVQQLRLLSRFTNHLLFSFDTDAAGIAATQRGIDLALHEGLDVRIIVHTYKDPDECISANPAEWRISVENAVPFIQFHIDTLLTPIALGDVYKKKEAMRAIIQSIALLPDRIEQDHWIRTCARRADLSEELLWQELSRGKRTETQRHATAQSAPVRMETTHMREELLFAALLKHPPLLFSLMPLISEAMLCDETHRELQRNLSSLLDTISETPDMVTEMTRATCTGEHVDRLLLLADKEWGDATEKELCSSAQNIAETIRSVYMREQIARLQQGMRDAEARGDTAAVAELTEQFHDLQNM